jgi:hypothetical protein
METFLDFKVSIEKIFFILFLTVVLNFELKPHLFLFIRWLKPAAMKRKLFPACETY